MLSVKNLFRIYNFIQKLFNLFKIYKNKNTVITRASKSSLLNLWHHSFEKNIEILNYFILFSFGGTYSRGIPIKVTKLKF